MIYNKLKYYFLSTLIVLFSAQLLGQSSYELNYSVTGNNSFKKKQIKIKTSFKDSISQQKELHNVLLKFQINGYIEAFVDSIIYNNQSIHIIINSGQQYKWNNLSLNKSNWENIPNIHYKSQDFNHTNFNYKELQLLFTNIITSLENTGYPFAIVKLANISIIKNEINAELIIDKGNFIKIDTIILNEYSKIKLGYIEQYLGINIGDAYNESKIDKINEQLNRSDIFLPSEASSIQFIENKANIHLYLKEKKGNMFNGIVGFQPNSTNTDQLQVTGQINLLLKNSFQYGETINLNWESFGGKSQKLKAGFKYPYLFNSPFGITYDIKLDKRDSSFLNINNRPSLLFALKGLNYISTYANFFISNSLGTADKITPSLGIIDMHSNSFGLELFINKLDYSFNPRKGYFIKTSADIGYKYYDQRSDVNPIIYDSIPSKEIKLSSMLEFMWFIPIFRQQTILLGNKSALLESENIMKNELYRIGGFKLLRGFDEQSIYANSYSVFNLEYRFLLDQNAYLGAFWDIGFVNNKLNSEPYDILQGFGISFSFASKAGIFNLAYALGKSNAENIQFKQSKIHFGYSALF